MTPGMPGYAELMQLGLAHESHYDKESVLLNNIEKLGYTLNDLSVFMGTSDPKGYVEQQSLLLFFVHLSRAVPQTSCWLRGWQCCSRFFDERNGWPIDRCLRERCWNCYTKVFLGSHWSWGRPPCTSPCLSLQLVYCLCACFMFWHNLIFCYQTALA